MAVAGGCGNMSGCGSRLPHEMPDARGSFPFGLVMNGNYKLASGTCLS